MTGRKSQGLAEAVGQFSEGTVLGIAGRSDNPEHPAEAYGTIGEKLGRLDVLVTNVDIDGPRRTRHSGFRSGQGT